MQLQSRGIGERATQYSPGRRCFGEARTLCKPCAFLESLKQTHSMRGSQAKPAPLKP